VFPEHKERKSPGEGDDLVTHTRTMVPLKLRFAWTTMWKKVQGQTFDSKIVLHLGKHEKEHGIAYTGTLDSLRVTRFSDNNSCQEDVKRRS